MMIIIKIWADDHDQKWLDDFQDGRYTDGQVVGLTPGQFVKLSEAVKEFNNSVQGPAIQFEVIEDED